MRAPRIAHGFAATLAATLATVLGMACASAPTETAPPPEVRALFEPSANGLDDVAFLAGSWARAEEGLWHEETWSQPRGGRMVGFAHVVRDGESAFTEALQIRVLAARVLYVATPEDEPTTAFPLVESRAGYARFEAPEHDFPRTIEYELVEDGVLEVRLAGSGEVDEHGHASEDAERRVSWRFRRQMGG